MRTIDWVDGGIELVDQTRLPHDLTVVRVTEVDDLIAAIERLTVRGAPALGVAGAFGVALLAHTAMPEAEVRAHAMRLRAARPTAVNLAWGVDRALGRLPEGPDAVLAEAIACRDEDIAASLAMGRRGATLLTDLVPDHPLRVMTICNTGGLAAVERGTALGVIQTLHERGELREVIAAETRPLLQGARLTAWELQRFGATYRLAVDSACPALLHRGYADVVVTGADRITARGDVANKIGTFALALAAKHAGVPFVVVAPESTVDPQTLDGSTIVIEDRPADEVVTVGGTPIAPADSNAVNPAFDVTDAELVTAIVTDQRVVRTDRGEAPVR
ncbi:MAG: S-methyl-5-thioribose-1-phosphate isomerase [Streptosporangiales bacterium]|nr:S-methyl-5-thioribose-1-phosphate isomerase [Streptosporangiales bacterium]